MYCERMYVPRISVLSLLHVRFLLSSHILHSYLSTYVYFYVKQLIGASVCTARKEERRARVTISSAGTWLPRRGTSFLTKPFFAYVGAIGFKVCDVTG
jgi:hypothetical protein